jgi:hypothetical protein
MIDFRKNTLWRVAILATGLFMVSCRQPNATGGTAAFDMAAYFSREANRMAEHKATLQKVARLNGRTETLVVDTPDWTGEFRVFSECGLDRTSWQQNYVCDTMPLAGGLRRIRYAARESAVRIAGIEIVEDALGPLSIAVEKRTANVFFRSSTRLRYVPDSGFVIRQDRKAFFQDPESLEIDGTVRLPVASQSGRGGN